MQTFLSSLPGPIAQGIIWGIMAMGVYITFRILDIADLTVDGTMGTGGVTLVVLVAGGMNVGLAMLIAFLAGCAAGLVTGIFHTKFGIPAILAGILTQLILYSVNLRITGQRSNVPLSVDKYALMLSLRNLSRAILVSALFAAAIIAIMYWFFGTELGHSLRATGCNQNMARANGINTDNNKMIGLVLSNGLVALSGALLAQYQGFADINMGRGAIVIGLAAVIIMVSYAQGTTKLLAAVFGGIIYYIVITLVLQMGLNANDLKMLSALVVAVFLGIPYWQKKLRERKSNKEVRGDA